MAKYILIKENMEQQTDDEDLKMELLEQGYVVAEKVAKNKETPNKEAANLLKLETALEESQKNSSELVKQLTASEGRNRELERHLEESQNRNMDLEKQLREKETTKK